MQMQTTGHWKRGTEAMASNPVDEDLRLRARERIHDGRLPNSTHCRTWGGRGSDEPCALCDLIIRPNEVEYEIETLGKDGVRTYCFHFLCHYAWQSECAAED